MAFDPDTHDFARSAVRVATASGARLARTREEYDVLAAPEEKPKAKPEAKPKAPASGAKKKAAAKKVTK